MVVLRSWLSVKPTAMDAAASYSTATRACVVLAMKCRRRRGGDEPMDEAGRAVSVVVNSDAVLMVA
jgi:hypothetical protein